MYWSTVSVALVWVWVTRNLPLTGISSSLPSRSLAMDTSAVSSLWIEMVAVSLPASTLAPALSVPSKVTMTVSVGSTTLSSSTGSEIGAEVCPAGISTLPGSAV